MANNTGLSKEHQKFLDQIRMDTENRRTKQVLQAGEEIKRIKANKPKDPFEQPLPWGKNK